MDASLLAADVREVAEGFCIPRTSRAVFCADLTRQIEAACRARPDWRRSHPYAWLAPIAEQAAALRDGLSGLGVDERMETEKRREAIEARLKDIGTLAEIGAKERTGSGINIQAFLGALDAIAECGAELVARGEARSASQPSRPPGTPGPRKKAFAVYSRRIRARGVSSRAL